MRTTRTTFLASAIGLALASCSTAETHAPGHDPAMGGPRMAGACEAPAAANSGREGCYFDAAVEIGTPPAEVYWHVDEYADAAAARAARGPGSAVIEAYGRYFLQTVNGRADWRPAGGQHRATVGPMPAPRGGPVTARFMQAMTRPGASTRPHRHDGAEAFYLVSGAICMETPGGAATTGAGETYWVAGGVPMQLTSAGQGLRRSLFVVLHPSSEPWMRMAPDFTPTGACAG